MKYEPQKSWVLLLKAAIGQGDVRTVQIALGALRRIQSEERTGDRQGKEAA